MAVEYEITYLTDPKLEDEARGELDSAVDTKIGEMTGAVSFSSPPLRQRLAYPMRKNLIAGMRTIQTDLPADKIEELRQFIRKQSGVLRVSVLRTPRREGVRADILVKHDERKKVRAGAKAAAKPAKAVTMEAVEKGIEEALTEEVK